MKVSNSELQINLLVDIQAQVALIHSDHHSIRISILASLSTKAGDPDCHPPTTAQLSPASIYMRLQPPRQSQAMVFDALEVHDNWTRPVERQIKDHSDHLVKQLKRKGISKVPQRPIHTWVPNFLQRLVLTLGQFCVNRGASSASPFW